MSQIHKPNPMEIHHFATGGTLDSHWSPADDTAVPNSQSVVPEFIEAVRFLGGQIITDTICLKDSREVSAEEQMHIATRVGESSRSENLVTSGTFLMPDISNAILRHPAAAHFDRIGKRVVVTGADVPLRDYSQSDSGFNLGMSVAVLQSDLKARVMIVMNGMCFDVEKGVLKDLTKAVFKSNQGNDILGYDDFCHIPVGGSIDFVHDGLDRLVPSRESLVPKFLRERVLMQRQFHAVNPFVKDSRDLSSEDFEVILETIKGSTNENILITLGIYKIQEVRDFLEKSLGVGHERRIVLTGSRMPIKGEEMTDASFNLGYALGKMGTLQKGVHVALNGIMMESGEDVVARIYTEEEQKILREMGVIKD